MDEERRGRLMRSIFETCTIEQTAEQIALFSAPRFARVYVERRGNAYRWSLLHRGGPYPLLRELAVLLDVPYESMALPFGSVDGWTYVLSDDLDGEPNSWALIEPSPDASVTMARLLEATA